MKIRRFMCCWIQALFCAGLLVAGAARAQVIDRALGVDPRVDYTQLSKLGPWDDRNYRLTKEDLALLSPNEAQQYDPIPAFFRVEMRKANPNLPRTGNAQYPRSALQIFELKYGGYLVSGQLYNRAIYRNGRFEVVKVHGEPEEEFAIRALAGDVRVSSPTGGAETAVKINPLDANKVIAGSNGPGSGQIMHTSANGGSSWTQAGALPLGSTCCDPTVDWSSDGTKAYAGTLGSCGASGCQVWVYRSGDNGATWSDLGADPRREITTGGISDKEYIHADKFATSPNRDNVYITWHDNNILKFSRSTDFGQTWSAALTLSGTGEDGIGSDITTDKSGNVFYFWPAVNTNRILVRKSTNGGVSFNPTVQVATTNDGYDFAIPAMETRRAFIYVSADADLTSGPFANSIYAAWTDTTAAESATAANNHARIRVAFSRDGGATWTVTTPHETADANTVDRFHPWVGVGPDGKVYVMFYDTRNNSARTSVDVYYSSSSDGGATWATPTRLTSVTSPHIEDSFQWGDYNGLDVVGAQLIAIFTDNRNESSGTADSVDAYAAAPGSVACTPPAAPTGVTATGGTNQVSLSWTASTGATEYHILRSTTSGGPYSQVGTATTTSFVNTGLACGTTYFYVVRAANSTTCESGNSAQASATTATCPTCTTTTLYNNTFETGTGLADWTRGSFGGSGSVTDWRGIQTCTAQGGTKIFRFGGTTCTADYVNNDFNWAQPNGASGFNFAAGSSQNKLVFGHRRAFESGFDGGTLRVSINGGTSWTYVPASALTGTTYNGTVSASCPPTGTAGVSIFTGSATTFSNTTVDLDAVCNLIAGGTGGCAGRNVRVAFTTITDCSVTGDGWFLDNVSVSSCVP
ncbi:MAG: hypothetical protein U0002_05500 [Thermoanaerobaculia bacterium]